MKLISRDAAIEAIDDLPNCYNGYSDTYDKAFIIGVLEELPSVDVPDRKVGKWIKQTEKYCWHYGCSECGFQPWYERSIYTLGYCPNCGARMGGEED